MKSLTTEYTKYFKCNGKAPLHMNDDVEFPNNKDAPMLIKKAENKNDKTFVTNERVLLTPGEEYYNYYGFNIKPANNLDAIIENNREYFDNLKEPVNLKAISIDGTCSVGKSSFSTTMYKPNKDLNLIAMNTHVSSAMGYVFTAIQYAQEKQVELLDRTVFNNLQWFYIWKIISYMFVTKFDKSLIDTIWQYYAECCLNDVVNDFCVKTSKIIYIINSDESTVYDRLRARNTGSDYERSHWPFYISIQNYMYYKFWEKNKKNICILDAGCFDSITDMHNVLASIIAETKQNIVVQPMSFGKLNTTKNRNILKSEHEEYERFRLYDTLKFTDYPKYK